MNNATAITLGIGNGSLAAPVCRLLGHVGVTETSASLKANQLRVLSTIMDAPVVVAVRPEDADDSRLRQMGAMLNGVHAAQHYVLLKMNAAKDNLAAIVDLLPSLQSPTVHKLYDSESVAVETVVSANELAMLTVKLKLAGARDIIWHAFDGLCATNGQKGESR